MNLIDYSANQCIHIGLMCNIDPLTFEISIFFIFFPLVFLQIDNDDYNICLFTVVIATVIATIIICFYKHQHCILRYMFNVQFDWVYAIF